MNKRIGKFTARNLVILYIILYTVMPLVNRLTSRLLTTYFYMGMIVVFVLIVVVMEGANNFNKYLTIIAPFLLFQLLSLFLPKEDWLLWGYNILLFVLPVILGVYLMEDNKRMASSYKNALIAAMIITMITTMIGCIQNPNAARTLATVSSQDVEAITFDMKNIGGYLFVYYIVLLYPVLILAYKTKKIRLLPALALSILIFATIVYSEYTTALLLIIMTSLLWLTKKDLSFKGIILISVLGILALFVFSSSIYGFFDWLSQTINSETMADRLAALAGGTKGLEAAEDNRIELYRISFDQFLRHPLFGTLFESKKTNGGHSFILDSLASYGVLGGALLFFMYKRIFALFFLPFKDKVGFGYVVWTFIQAIILSTFNTGMWLEVLCLFCPILFYWIYGTETKAEKNNYEDTVDSQFASGTAG